MEEQGLKEFIRNNKVRQENAYVELVGICRSLPALLSDLGHKATAQRVEAQLFLIDAIKGEILARFEADPKKCTNELLSMLGPPDA